MGRSLGGEPRYRDNPQRRSYYQTSEFLIISEFPTEVPHNPPELASWALKPLRVKGKGVGNNPPRVGVDCWSRVQG